VSAPHVVVVGDVAVDVRVEPAGPPAPGGDTAARIRRGPGGAGANTAAWLAHLGATATLVARVGDDDAGRTAQARLRTAGVRTRLAVDPDAPTCTVVVVLAGSGSGRDRTMYSDRGAAALLRPSDLPAGLLDEADHLHVSGYLLADPGSRAAGLAALEAARATGVSTSVDPQGTSVPSAWGPVDLLLPNAAELHALTGSADPAAAVALLDRAGAVAVTRGPAGAAWVDRTGRWEVPAVPATVVDPTGAGDAFDAGLVLARLRGAAPERALAAGCTAAAAAVGTVGGRPVADPAQPPAARGSHGSGSAPPGPARGGWSGTPTPR